MKKVHSSSGVYVDVAHLQVGKAAGGHIAQLAAEDLAVLLCARLGLRRSLRRLPDGMAVCWLFLLS